MGDYIVLGSAQGKATCTASIHRGTITFSPDPGSSGYFGFTNGEHIPPKVLKTSFVCSGPVHYLRVWDRLARDFEGGPPFLQLANELFCVRI